MVHIGMWCYKVFSEYFSFCLLHVHQMNSFSQSCKIKCCLWTTLFSKNENATGVFFTGARLRWQIANIGIIFLFQYYRSICSLNFSTKYPITPREIKKKHKDIHPVNLKYKEIKEEALVWFVEENFWQKLHIFKFQTKTTEAFFQILCFYMKFVL